MPGEVAETRRYIPIELEVRFGQTPAPCVWCGKPSPAQAKAFAAGWLPFHATCASLMMLAYRRWLTGQIRDKDRERVVALWGQPKQLEAGA